MFIVILKSQFVTLLKAASTLFWGYNVKKDAALYKFVYG